MRPYTLPTELPDPPKPPTGTRWVYRGKGWNTYNSMHYAYLTSSGERWNTKNSRPVGQEGVEYLEAVSLRQPPSRIPNPPDGFEYLAEVREVKGGKALKGIANPDIAYLNSPDQSWGVGAYGRNGSSGCHYALRIGSEIHHKNFDPPDSGEAAVPDPAPVAPLSWVSRNTGYTLKADLNPPEDLVSQMKTLGFDLTSNLVPLVPVAGKAREFWLSINAGHDTPWSNLYDEDSSLKPRVHVREVLPGESSLLEQAVGFLKDWHRSGGCPVGVASWLEENFLEPPFDWSPLWAELPSWFKFIAMDDDGEWNAYVTRPERNESQWGHSLQEGEYLLIPSGFAPPAAVNWRTSLEERPTP